jgi:thiol-disulfide isomerase/thioredoxin
LGSPDEYKIKLEELKAKLFYEFKTINDHSFIKKQKVSVDRFLRRYISNQAKLLKQDKNVRRLMFERAEIDKRYDFDAAIYSLNSEQFSVMLKEYSDAISSWLSKMTDNDAFKNANEQRLQRDIKWWREKKINIDNVPKEGEPAKDFNYADKDGNEFSLSSFKGRLVYLDVWATWCGPCIVEIPALKKLEEVYQDKKITFLSISIDKDKEAWMKMLDEKKLGGIQLWAGDLWESNSISGIAKDYAIYGIPRFMLFSADGNVISTNAPRPSAIEIKGLLGSNLELIEEE